MDANIRGFLKQSKEFRLKCFFYRKDGIYYETNWKTYNLTKLFSDSENSDNVIDFLDNLIDNCEMESHKRQVREVMKDLIYNKNL